MSLSTQDLELIDKLLQKLKAELKTELKTELRDEIRTEIRAEIAPLKNQVTALSSELASVKRTVDAIETLPVPYGRPKTYFSAVKYHSVTRPKIVRLGRQG